MSPYKDKVLQREAVKKAVHKYRVLHTNNEGITEQGDNIGRDNKLGITEGDNKEGLTRGVNKEGLTQYHPILEYLVEKRDKLERICHSLRQHNQLGEVYFGCRQPLSFDIVEGLLQATS